MTLKTPARRRGLGYAIPVPRVKLFPQGEASEAPAKLALTPMSEIDALIAAGYGDTPQTQIPPDWRTRVRTLKAGRHGR